MSRVLLTTTGLRHTALIVGPALLLIEIWYARRWIRGVA